MQFVMRFKAWRSNKDRRLHVIVRDEEFEQLPQVLRSCGPWFGSSEGPIEQLKPTYRAMLALQGFAVVYSPTAFFKPEITKTV